MKLLTLNTHSYIEPRSEKKLKILTDALSRIQPDIIALQEVNQLHASRELGDIPLISHRFGIAAKCGNFGLRVAEAIGYNLVWLGIKRGYKIYDEGICFLTKKPATSADSFLLSQTNDESNWKKRMALLIKYDGEYFCNLHMGRWDDSDEPFIHQWERLMKNISALHPVWLMGDFNCPADCRSEGYDCIKASGFFDTYDLAKAKDGGHTVSGSIAGWRDKKEDFENKRIDFIFTDTNQEIASSFTIFNGKYEEVVSDHYGILIERK